MSHQHSDGDDGKDTDFYDETIGMDSQSHIWLHGDPLTDTFNPTFSSEHSTENMFVEIRNPRTSIDPLITSSFKAPCTNPFISRHMTVRTEHDGVITASCAMVSSTPDPFLSPFVSVRTETDCTINVSRVSFTAVIDIIITL